MVLKKVKWTYFGAYLWQTMWNHTKNSMEELKLPDSVFLHGDVRSSVLKTQKNTKTRQTKTPVTQFFQIIRPIQGCTMSKSMPGAFQKCITYGGGDDLTLSYGPPKSTQISFFSKAEMRCSKKVTATIFKIEAPYRISVNLTHLIPRWFNRKTQFWKLWPWLFF